MAKQAESLAEARSHNVPAAVFLKHYRSIRNCKTEHKETGAAVARAKKAAKNAGIDLAALSWLEKLTDLDTDEAEMQLRHLTTYAQWLSLPIGMQLNMFGQPEPATVDAKTAAEHREWQAGEDGLMAGRAGHERDTNLKDPGSAEHAAWDLGWRHGHEDWLEAQQTIASEMGPPPGKRVRPPSNGASAEAH